MTGLFAGSLVGCSVQGWLRDVGSDRLVRRRSWPEDASVGGANVVFVSEEDVEDDARALARWQREAGIVVVTEGKGGATVWTEGHQRRIAAFPHAEVDATGAGDVFAAAFLVAFAETGDVSAAARFADAAAGLSVEGVGTAKAPTWAEAQQVLTEHKEIVLA
jgi:sugar/nucleoside kinase (ribokinase family)